MIAICIFYNFLMVCGLLVSKQHTSYMYLSKMWSYSTSHHNGSKERIIHQFFLARIPVHLTMNGGLINMAYFTKCMSDKGKVQIIKHKICALIFTYEFLRQCNSWQVFNDRGGSRRRGLVTQ